MGTSNVVVPCAVLGSIVFCMLAFICWWFPRTWVKGIALDKREFAERRQRERELAAMAPRSETTVGGGQAGGVVAGTGDVDVEAVAGTEATADAGVGADIKKQPIESDKPVDAVVQPTAEHDIPQKLSKED